MLLGPLFSEWLRVTHASLPPLSSRSENIPCRLNLRYESATEWLATPRQTNRLRYFCLPVRYRVTRANVHESGRKKRAYSLPTAALVSSPCLGEHWIRKFITRGLPLWVLYARYHTAVISEKSRHYADGPTDGTTTTTTPNFLHLAP